MGLGRFGGGVAAARWLTRQGALVTVTDLAEEASLAESLTELRGEPIATYHLGGHRPDDFRHADLVVVNPAVRPENPLLQLARDAGATLTSEMELFLRECSAKVIGVTGSNGKSTTAAMIAAILRAAILRAATATEATRRVWLGGNLGGSLLDQLDQIQADDWVVLEISSFQLWHLADDAPMPHAAVVTSCTPNHLDWHGSFPHYAAAKQRILRGQTADDVAVLNTFNPEVASWAEFVAGRLVALPDDQNIPPLRLPGEHNRLDARLATAAALAVGCTEDAIRKGLSGYRGLPQRLELFAVVDGRSFYNDSTATTPESTIAALEAIDEPVWLLAGGRNKGIDLSNMADSIAQNARGVAFFGTVRNELLEKTRNTAPHLPLVAAETLDEAVQWCWVHSRPGEAIVLSPGCASTDQFLHFRHRGARFVELVTQLAERVKRQCETDATHPE